MTERTPVIVAGSRSIESYDVVKDAIERTFEAAVRDGIVRHSLEIVSGTADGPDSLGVQWAAEYGVPVETFRPDWENTTPTKAAGPIRNTEMAEYADILVAVWDGSSSGTKDMIETALDLGLEVHVYQPGSDDG